MYYFDIFPVYFLLANIPVAMILPIVMAGGIAVMVCEAVGSDPVWLCSAVDGIYDVMLRWIELITGFCHIWREYYVVCYGFLLCYSVSGACCAVAAQCRVVDIPGRHGACDCICRWCHVGGGGTMVYSA